MTKPDNDFTPAKTSFEAFEESMLTGKEVDYLEVVPRFTQAEAYMFGPLCDNCNFVLVKGPHVCFGTILNDDSEEDEDDE